jgi:hypothetical protein
MPVKTSKTDTISPDDKPVRATLRTYQVGFGDCFLLIFEYTSGKKVYTLIDFGSTQLPDFSPPDQMTRVAEDIQKECGGKLDIVIATHRHKDHISGFSTDGAGTGKIIRDCNPKVVLQPWTEDPNLDDDKVKLSTAAGAPAETGKALNAGQVQSLLNMNKVADSAFKEAEHLSDDRFAVPLPNTVANQLNFLAVDNGIPNRSAVANLAAMGKESHYISYGTDLSFLNQILPNVKITVMGPPTLEQDDKIKKEKSSDKNEFWMLYATTSKSAGEFIDEEEDLFPGADVFEHFTPSHARWFVRKLRGLRGEQLLQIVRILDEAMNNTSLILFFEAGNKKLLFPGDAQIENWEYALKLSPDHENNLRDLKQTDLYKVGHHGSRNATPKTLWNTFGHKVEEAKKAPDRLKTVVSTLFGKHGNPSKNTEVPRKTLVDALSSLSDYYTTQTMNDRKDLFHDIVIDL